MQDTIITILSHRTTQELEGIGAAYLAVWMTYASYQPFSILLISMPDIDPGILGESQ